MRHPVRRFALDFMALAAAAAGAHAAGPALYETGPAQDSAFVRFVNATGARLEVVAGNAKARLPLPADKPVSDFQSVRPNTEIKGQFEGGGARSAIALKTAPGAFATVVAWTAPGQAGVRTTVLTETPDDFNALKAALAFYNLDAGCKAAGLQAAGRGVAIFSGVGHAAIQRRAVNPVALSVQPTCEGQPRGAALNLGALQAGQRYSVLLVPGADAPRVIFATDAVAR